MLSRLCCRGTVCKPALVLDMHCDRTDLISRIEKLKAYGLEGLVARIFPPAGKGARSVRAVADSDRVAGVL